MGEIEVIDRQALHTSPKHLTLWESSKVALAISASLSLAWIVSVVATWVSPQPPSIWILGYLGTPVSEARSSDIILLTIVWFGSNLASILRHIWTLRMISTGAPLVSALVAALVPLAFAVGVLFVFSSGDWIYTVVPGAVAAFTFAAFIATFTGLARCSLAIYFSIGTFASAILTALFCIGLEFMFFCC